MAVGALYQRARSFASYCGSNSFLNNVRGSSQSMSEYCQSSASFTTLLPVMLKVIYCALVKSIFSFRLQVLLNIFATRVMTLLILVCFTYNKSHSTLRFTRNEVRQKNRSFAKKQRERKIAFSVVRRLATALVDRHFSRSAIVHRFSVGRRSEARRREGAAAEARARLARAREALATRVRV